MIALAASTILIITEAASAQDFIRPRWNAYGSPVCPKGWDYFEGWCRPVYDPGYGNRGYYRRDYGRYGRATAPARWNAAGSAVCPRGFDYDARIGLCVSVD
jgi:hypothetical protein